MSSITFNENITIEVTLYIWGNRYQLFKSEREMKVDTFTLKNSDELISFGHSLFFRDILALLTFSFGINEVLNKPFQGKNRVC